MNKYCKIEWRGKIIDSSKISVGVQALLADVGSATVAEMKEHTKEHDVSKRLSNSITWQTSNKGSNAYGEHRDEDKIDSPTEDGVLYVGSNAPHALFREIGSGIHRTADGHEQFEESMKEWCKAVLGIDPDRSPGEAYDFAMVLKHVRDNFTDAAPFLAPTMPEIPKIVNNAWLRAEKLLYKEVKGK